MTNPLITELIETTARAELRYATKQDRKAALEAEAKLRKLVDALAEDAGRVAEMAAFLSDFAATKFEQIDRRGKNWRGPEDDEDPVTDWMAVDAWQDDARKLIEART